MRSEQYKGFMLWGHAILQQNAILRSGRYAAGGTITKDNKVVEASSVLGEFVTEDEAELVGLQWAHAWVDGLG